MIFKPTIFIGSSKEGEPIAKKIAALLTEMADVKLWTKAFDYGYSNFDNLASKISFYDYAIMIATGDDVLISRGKKRKVSRDNVLFEFGLFTGGLGKNRVFYIVEEDTKIPSDLLGITLPFIPKMDNSEFDETLNVIVESIKDHIEGKENTFDLGFLPSTVLAYGYFTNFIERTVERLLEDKEDRKEFILQNGTIFTLEELKVTILLPDDLRSDMFKKVYAKRLRDGWQRLKVDPKHVREYDFSIDITKAASGELHLVDIPLTLNALNKSIEIYSKRQHIGKDAKENLLEIREIKNFKKVLEYLINQSSITRELVNVEIVSI